MLLAEVTGLEAYHLCRPARGELLLGIGDREGVAAVLRRAWALTAQPGEQRHLDRCLASVAPW